MTVTSSLRRICILTAALLLVYVYLGRGAIISQSAIKDCSWGDPSEPKTPSGTVCKKKMLVSMVLGAGQGNTESLHANVDRAHEPGKKNMSMLKKPFRIELRKTAVIVSYRAHLIGSANALPKEISIAKKKCKDGFFERERKLACGIQYHGKTKKRVWDSQGFCCKCTGGRMYNRRGGHGCGFGELIQQRGSAHCMKMHDLWYDVYSLDVPMMQYKITLDVMELQNIHVNNLTKTRNVEWKLLSTFHLSPSRTIARSTTGKVIAELQGSLLGSKAIRDFSNRRLIIPSVKMWPKTAPHPKAYLNGPSDWMLVDTNMVQLLGTECNKIGVSYTGFRRQPQKCQIGPGFCFTNQPLQLWKFDDNMRKKKKSGRYMLHNFGKVHHGSHPNNDSFILKYYHEDLHNSFVTLRIDASDISFVRSVSSGRIVETYIVPFTAAVGHGYLTVELGNTGEVTSEYSVSVVKCTSGLHSIPARSLTLAPGQVKNTSFTLRSGDTDGGKKQCEVQLYDSNFNLLDMAKIDIKVGAACLCFGICGCVCEDKNKTIGKSPARCPAPGPPVIYQPGPIALVLFFMALESIGAHGFIGFFASILLVCGFIKLSCGGVICCRKTKQQEYSEKQLEKGVPPKSPLLVQCSGECRGAKAARGRYERKVKRLQAAGKSPHRLDDWRNTSFECHCKTELTDVRMVHIVRAVCFFYFIFVLPLIWIGRCITWRILKDTEANMAKAERQVLARAKKKGKLEKYGIIDLGTELKKFEEEAEKKRKDKEEERNKIIEALAMNLDYSNTAVDAATEDNAETKTESTELLEKDENEGAKEENNQTENQAEKQAENQTEDQTEKQAENQAEKQDENQAEDQTENQAEKQDENQAEKKSRKKKDKKKGKKKRGKGEGTKDETVEDNKDETVEEDKDQDIAQDQYADDQRQEGLTELEQP